MKGRVFLFGCGAALGLALIAACGGDAESAKRPAGPRAVLITAVAVQPR